MRLGLSSYTYTWSVGVPGHLPDAPLTALGLVEKAVERGVSVLQIADNLPLDRLSQAALREFQQEAKRRGIQIEVGTRGIQPDHLDAYRKLAALFDSPILRVVIDAPDHRPSIEETIALLQESLAAFEAAGIRLAIENHDRFSVKDFIRILESLDSPYVGICLDTVNSFGALEGPEVVLEALAPWTINLHIKDFNIRRAEHMMGFIIEGRPAGQGRLDIPWLLDSLASSGRDVNAILELWTPPESTLESTIAKEDRWARDSVRYLRTLIRES